MANLEDVVNRAIQDFDNIEAAIQEKGVEVPQGTDTSEYSKLVDEVYGKGLVAGMEAGIQAGKQAEYDAFWDALQAKGGSQNYYYAFAYGRFSDKNYNPKYPIVCIPNQTTPSQAIFYGATGITDTKVPITASNTLQSAFYGCNKLVTIRKLIVTASTLYTTAFGDCAALENITFEGVINNSIDLRGSKLLTHDSLMSIINALRDNSSSGTSRSLQIGSANIAKLTEAELQIITEKGWNYS